MRNTSIKNRLNTLLTNERNVKSSNPDGSATYVKTQIFSDIEIDNTIQQSVIATSTMIGLDEDIVIDNHSDLVVEYAWHLALLSKSCTEAGRRINIYEPGIEYTSPDIASHLMDVARILLDNWHRRINLVRMHLGKSYFNP